MNYFSILTIIFLNLNLYAKSADEINAFIKSQKFKDKNLGLLLTVEGKTLYELNSDKLMTPASLTKIFTGGAILSQMPMNTKFSTELLSKGTIENGNLKGSLCLKGAGDPAFVSEKMWFLVNELTRNEINKIEGDLIVDATKFDNELFDSGRDSVRVDRAFDAPISAMSFNWNSVNVFVRPAKKVGDNALVYIDPINTYIELENKVKTSKDKKAINVERVKVNDHDKIIVTGTIPVNSSEFVAYKSITNPNLWAGNHLIQFLKQRNIELKGNIKMGKCEENSIKLASVDSKYLNEIVGDMLKYSNNFVAEMLAKNLAAQKAPEKSASMKDGIEEIKKFIDLVGIKRADYQLENVSGLTRENKFSAQQIVKTLIFVRNDFQIFPEYLSGLPIAGIDGTLKNRFKNNTDYTVRAKTGYLDGVVGLAGFVGRKNKAPIIFAFMYNGDYEQALEARKLFDGIIERVSKWD